jgi:hypothetical protein
VRFLHRARRHGRQTVVGQVEVSSTLIHALFITKSQSKSKSKSQTTLFMNNYTGRLLDRSK